MEMSDLSVFHEICNELFLILIYRELFSHNQAFSAIGIYELESCLGVIPRQKPCFDYLLEQLISYQWIRRENQIYFFKSISQNKIYKAREALEAYNNIGKKLIILFEVFSKNYLSFLRGDRMGEEMNALFDLHGCSLHSIFQELNNADQGFYFCHKQLTSMIAQHPFNNVSILEVGCGQGLLTEKILYSLDDKITKYIMTDVNLKALSDTQNRFKEPLGEKIKTGYLNIQKASDFSVAHNGFDFIVGLDTLHLIDDFAASLPPLMAMLNDRGVCLFIETVKVIVWQALLMGIFLGWRFEKRDQRIIGSPLLTTDGWVALFSELGIDVQIKTATTNSDKVLIILSKKNNKDNH